MGAIYNDTERFACDWLQHLMDAGLIMPGKIDDRSIADLSPDDLAGYERVHLFAGIGGWDFALQLAQWPAGKPVWTCSCPCPPFSQAGKRQRCPRCSSQNLVWCPRRTGHCICADCSYAWLADGRHLWPEAWRLISRGRPPVVLGEQVASPDGLEWLAGVRASLEILSYAPWGADYPAAGVGAPHIRQRIWWLADTVQPGRAEWWTGSGRGQAAGSGGARGVADTHDGLTGHGGLQPGREHGQQQEDDGVGGMANSDVDRTQRFARDDGETSGISAEKWADQRAAVFERSGATGRLVDADQPRSQGRIDGSGEGGRADQRLARSTSELGFWSAYDLVHCTDGKARRVPQSSLLRLADGLPTSVVRGGFEGAEGFPLAEGATNRVGRLCGYGNAINPYAAARFIRAWREVSAA